MDDDRQPLLLGAEAQKERIERETGANYDSLRGNNTVRTGQSYNLP